jgi:4-alpha-glucanotransferase
LFAPAYALRSDRDWGAGDLADLEALAALASRWGGSATATLPLLAGFLDKPFEPSPYRPVSRLFWNEFYLALDLIPEWRNCPAARELWASSGEQAQLCALRASELVDYRQVARLKREVLEEMARFFFASEDVVRKESFASYLDSCGSTREYAHFRAEVENHGSDWRDWPQRWEKPWPPSGAGEAAPRPASQSERYHLYCQWQMEEQLSNLAKNSGVAGLFLDLPVGVHPGGFDTWRWPGLFAHDMSAGAPPDRFFSLGQHWDSPPLHPEKIGEDGHGYFACCVRHHMRQAAYLRIDHVMSLHRLFWVPLGAPPASGVYVNYPAEELYSVLSLESHRNGTVVVGEDLGTVPQGVRSAMRRYGVSRTWVMQMSFRARGADPVPPVPPGAVASLNTHDMFPFAGFVEGDDIRIRLATGQVNEGGARREAAARARLVARLRVWAEEQQSDADLLRALLKHLRRSPAGLTLVNLEDLLLETRPQNVPGTGPEWGNWRRKARERLPQNGRGPDCSGPQ